MYLSNHVNPQLGKIQTKIYLNFAQINLGQTKAYLNEFQKSYSNFL